MDPLADLETAIAFNVWFLLLLLRSNKAPLLPPLVEAEDDEENPFLAITRAVGRLASHPHTEMRATLNHFRLFLSFNLGNAIVRAVSGER
ncbi:hypothetical protein M758_UG314300 [Ceratodon purpureus]|nr:hypothetical protein M758_UG314300 [Ceratodon purpureus]